MVDKIDDQINKLFDVVRKQREEVEAAEKEAKQSWKTKCTVAMPFSRDESNGNRDQTPVNTVNIQTANEEKIKNLVMALLKHRDYAAEAEQVLGLTQTNLYDGSPYDDWIVDCKKRITVLSIKAKKDLLAKAELRLNAIVSPEQKRAMELAEITKSLAD
jgi:hypothetical protein